MAVLEVLSGVGVAVEVLVGRRVLKAVLSTRHSSAGLASVWPSAVLLGVITALGLAGVVLREQQRPLISHRYSTVRAADRIYVLREGEVVEAGTHESLMALGGTYAELFTLQATPYQ